MVAHRLMKDFNFDGKNTIIPEGIYRVTDTIVLGGCLLRGAGIGKTVLVANFDDPKKAIFHMGWTSKLENMTICFKDGLVTGNEGFGERVAIYTKSHFPLQKCAYIRNVEIDNVGTGIFSTDNQSICFSVMFENISVKNFSFRGFDFSSAYRTGNIYSDIYLSSGKYSCDSAFYFGCKVEGDEESETTLKNLIIKDTCARIPLNLETARGFIAENITLDNVKTDSESLVFFQEFAGCIDNLTIKNSVFDKAGMIKIGVTSNLTPWGSGHIRIKSLNLISIKGTDKKFKVFKRDNRYTDDVYITVDNYIIEDCDNKDILEKFPIEGEMIFTRKGEPVNKERLCKYYSCKKDEFSGNELVWNGEQWC